MKYFLSLFKFFLVLFLRRVDRIYDITLKTIDGIKVALSQFKGKKLLVIQRLLSAQNTNDAGKLKKIYKDADANIIIAEGMKVKKGTGQSSLFQWLTNKDMNRHFDKDVDGVGSKFFLDEKGELYAVMGPRLALTDPLMDRIITRSPYRSNKENKK